MNKIHLLKASYFEVHFLEGNFIFSYEKNITVDLDKFREFKDACTKIRQSVGGTFPMISVITGFVVVEKKARNELKKYFEEKDFYAHAIISSSLVIKAMMVLIIKLIGSPTGPYHHFDSITAGKNWLLETRIELKRECITDEEVMLAFSSARVQ